MAQCNVLADENVFFLIEWVKSYRNVKKKNSPFLKGMTLKCITKSIKRKLILVALHLLALMIMHDQHTLAELFLGRSC